jgi:hypothetical protein
VNASNTRPKSTSAGAASQETLDLTRRKVREMLTKSQAFSRLPPAAQQEIARHTVQIASYLAEPEGIRADGLPTAGALAGDRYATGMADTPTTSRRGQVGREGVFVAQGAREGAAAAGALLREVNFPTFVSSLIDGVFHSIVQASIQQMEAYGKLVADVAKTLNQFRDENVTANQGRDHLVDTYPDLFQIETDTGDFGEGGGPRVKLRDGVDEEAALQRVKDLPVEGSPLTSLDDDAVEDRLVPAARTQLATSRQQLLATMVLMGINRIVVTEGKISAKVMYNFQAQDNFRFQKSATRFDYDPNARTYTGSGTYEGETQGAEYKRTKEDEERRNASYYSKGSYQYSNTPALTLASATQEATDAALQTRAQLAGNVEVNFKSETFPLEKMADSFQIGAIQNAARPGRAGAPASRGTAAAQPAAQPAP